MQNGETHFLSEPFCQSETEVEVSALLLRENEKVDPPFEMALRPRQFSDFPGQEGVINKLKVFIEAARKREKTLDHILLSGPPGLGKTTLAHIIALAMNGEMRSTSAPALHRKGDLAAILTSLRPGSIFFIDEIHRLNRDVEEYLYSAMEDFFIDIITGEGLGARSMRFQLAPFTLVGATTRSGLLNAPFRDRFGIQEHLTFYNKKDLLTILKRSAQLLEIPLDEGGAGEIASRSRGTPRIANRLLKRVRDYAEVRGDGMITSPLADYALQQLEVDYLGLDAMDRRILYLIRDKFSGGPVGIDTLSSALNEECDTLEEVYEPYLIQEGLLQKTPRGRVLTSSSLSHLKNMDRQELEKMKT
ncbi:MAG: Holliday junction branch migration DNA helicase RuvB [Bdellovibrionales bacterium]|nr:Holliday junction branch migration DNA helicase RuvB [Bdellovibrionales bacterium]